MLIDPPIIRIVRHFSINGQDYEDEWEGELEMQTDELKEIIGDGKAKITISRELSEKSYGNGGSLFVSITLTTDQSHESVAKAIDLARHYAETTIQDQFDGYRKQIEQLLSS